MSSQTPGADHLHGLRARRQTVVIDGGMGTELEAQGATMDHHAWSGLANLRDPGLVQRVHEAYVRAGADVLITNTFMSGTGPLTRAGEGERFEEANRAAVAAARGATAIAGGRRVVVAGSVSVTQLGAPETGDATGEARHRRLRDGYLRQIEVLIDEGVDLIALEMVDHPLYAEPAVEAAGSVNFPLWFGFCVSGDQSTETSGAITDEHRAVMRLVGEASFDAVCVMHTDIHDVDDALALVNQNWAGPVGVYPHHGVWVRPHWQFADLPPRTFVGFARDWQANGVAMIGGCCGIRPDHIAALRAAVDRT
jgi:S-methylmethionine-dependent homocysteine/selenocysteine methylase